MALIFGGLKLIDIFPVILIAAVGLLMVYMTGMIVDVLLSDYSNEDDYGNWFP